MKDTKKLVTIGMLSAIILLMAFTPVGYIKTVGIEITLIMVPVVIGAIIGGPAVGAILGGLFGITSFIQCFGMSAFGATLLGINPVGAFITCLVPRILCGWLCGLSYKAFAKYDHKKFWSFAASSFVGSVLNTVLFTTSLLLFFINSEFIQGMMAGKNILAFAAAFVGINGLIEACVCIVLATAISKPLKKYFV